MKLLEYIKKNYKTPNVAVLRTLGASEELIEYLTNTPWNTNIKIIEGLISGGDGDEKQGIKSINISPAITTTPALESLFPIYYDDLTEEQKHNGVTLSLTTDAGLAVDEEHTFIITPTTDMYIIADEPGGKGEPVTVTGHVVEIDGKIGIRLTELYVVSTLEEPTEEDMEFRFMLNIINPNPQ